MEFAQLTQLLTADEKAEYLALLKTFESSGWTMLKERFAGVRAGFQAEFESATTWEANRYAKGARDACDFFLSAEEGIEKYFEEIATVRLNDHQENLAEADRTME